MQWVSNIWDPREAQPALAGKGRYESGESEQKQLRCGPGNRRNGLKDATELTAD